MNVNVVFLVGISPHDISDEQQYEINYENEVYGECAQDTKNISIIVCVEEISVTQLLTLLLARMCTLEIDSRFNL